MPGARVGRRGRGQAYIITTIMSPPHDHYGSGVIVQLSSDVKKASWTEVYWVFIYTQGRGQVKYVEVNKNNVEQCRTM